MINEAKTIYQVVKPLTMVSQAGVEFTIEQAFHMINDGVPGCFVECGVWKGGCSLAMLYAQRHLFGEVTRHVYMLDNFEGMEEPHAIDGPRAKEWYKRKDPANWHDGCKADRADVECAFREEGFGTDDFTIKQGDLGSNRFLLDFPQKPIALLRIDCDWYRLIYPCLWFLTPLVSKDGVVIIDDYYAWDGAATALHRFLDHKGLSYRIESYGNNDGAYFRVT